MKTAEEIIAFLEKELTVSNEMQEQEQDSRERLLHVVKSSTIAGLLEVIKEG